MLTKFVSCHETQSVNDNVKFDIIHENKTKKKNKFHRTLSKIVMKMKLSVFSCLPISEELTSTVHASASECKNSVSYFLSIVILFVYLLYLLKKKKGSGTCFINCFIRGHTECNLSYNRSLMMYARKALPCLNKGLLHCF